MNVKSLGLQFTIMLDLLEDYMTAKGYSYERIDGKIRGSDRQVVLNLKHLPLFAGDHNKHQSSLAIQEPCLFWYFCRLQLTDIQLKTATFSSSYFPLGLEDWGLLSLQ